VRTDYDAIVIGSGAGGSAAAYQLTLAGLSAVVIEKGGVLPTDGSTLDARRVVVQREFVSHEPWLDGANRTLVPEEHFNVGGKTKWYGAALLRFSAQEFEADEPHGCHAWPLSLADMVSYYEQAEQLLQVRHFGVEADLRRILGRVVAPGSLWRSMPLPMALAEAITGDALEATHFDGFASARGLKHDAENALLAPLTARANFSLLTHSEVVALLADDADPYRVIGVRLHTGRELTAQRVLLGAGALHSPRLLARHLAATGLASSLPGAVHVGRYLKMHLLTAMIALSAWPIGDRLRKTALLTHDHFSHSSVQPLGFDAELLCTLLPAWLPAPLSHWMGRRAYGFFLQTEDGSDPRNSVRDGTSGRPPILDYDATRLAPALREHGRFTWALQRALLGAGMLAFTRRMTASGTAHACGTLRCGRDPHESVVDADGSVHGLRGLFVVDGSVLPRSSRVNPALTIAAWGLRVGERIARDLHRGSG
jgi:choline dehydrogenase-like flavoprotein